MEKHAVSGGNSGNIGDRIYRADFVIPIHETHQNSFRRNGSFYIVRTYPAILVHREVCGLKSFCSQSMTGIKNRVMLCRACNDMVSLFSTSVGDPSDGEIIRFGRPTGKNNLFCRTTEQFGDLVTCFFYGIFAVIPNGCVLEAFPKFVVR